MVTGFLFVIFYRNQLQRSSSKETLCAREVHRMVLSGLNVQILHQKMLLRRTCSSETKQFFSKILITYFQVCANFDLLWSVSNQGRHDPHLSTLKNRLQRHLRYPQEIWNIYQKKYFSRNFKNPKKFWISEKN